LHLLDARKLGLLHPARPGGRFTEKLLTLTAPHRGDTGARLEWIARAVPRFMRMLRARWKTLGIDQFCKWFRVYEWTPGTDGKGHPK
jgi:hypothetical protein